MAYLTLSHLYGEKKAIRSLFLDRLQRSTIIIHVKPFIDG